MSTMNEFTHTKQQVVDKFIELGYDNNVVTNGIDNVNTRLSWNIHSECLIYSRSKQIWFQGVIVEIFVDSSNQEWLVIKYNGCKKKKIQRFCADVKPMESYDDIFKVKDVVNYAKIINKIKYQETRVKLCVYGYTRIYCGPNHLPPDIQQLCVFIYTTLYISIDEKLKKSTLTITFHQKPLGFTIYRGENENNAWIADIRPDNIYKKQGLKIGLYVHSINDEIVDNYLYYGILTMIRDLPAPITVGFNTHPPLNPNDIQVEILQSAGYTYDEIQYGWQQLNKMFETITPLDPRFECEMSQILSKLYLL